MTSLEQEHNPYAAPAAELQVQGVASRAAELYPMSPVKAGVMSALTFSIYDLVFWYRHWTRIKESGHDVMPIGRAIFAPFFAFDFLTRLAARRASRGLESSLALRSAPGIYLGLAFASRITEKLAGAVPSLIITMIACVGGGWALATIQTGANEVLKADHYQGPSNSGITFGSVFAGLFGVVFWAIVIAGVVSPESFPE